MYRDVTDHVEFSELDDEMLPITKCVCGATFPKWHETLSIYYDQPWECPYCGRKLFFTNKVTVYEIVETNNTTPTISPSAGSANQ